MHQRAATLLTVSKTVVLASVAARMRNLMRVILVVARTMVAANVPLPSEPPQPFTDVAASAHRAAIAQMAELDLVHGIRAGSYAPRAAVTRGQVWRQQCPVALDDLVVLNITHWDFNAEPRRGHVIVPRSVAGDLADKFSEMYDARFQIARMRPVHTYAGGEQTNWPCTATARDDRADRAPDQSVQTHLARTRTVSSIPAR
jgi:hypothetical protein